MVGMVEQTFLSESFSIIMRDDSHLSYLGSQTNVFWLWENHHFYRILIQRINHILKNTIPAYQVCVIVSQMMP